MHGVAIMSVREGLEFGTEIESDCAPLHGLVAAMLAVDHGPPRAARPDPRRAGRLAQRDRRGRRRRRRLVEERASRCPPVVANACAILGLDPMYVANEGKLVAFVPREHADAVLAAMRAHPLGARRRGDRRVRRRAPRAWSSPRTGFGGTRVVDLPIGEQLPRIC